MSTQVTATAATGLTDIYLRRHRINPADGTAQVLTSVGLWHTFSAAAIADYSTPAVEEGATGRYIATLTNQLDGGEPPETHLWYQQVGGAPAESDPIVASYEATYDPNFNQFVSVVQPVVVIPKRLEVGSIGNVPIILPSSVGPPSSADVAYDVGTGPLGTMLQDQGTSEHKFGGDKHLSCVYDAAPIPVSGQFGAQFSVENFNNEVDLFVGFINSGFVDSSGLMDAAQVPSSAVPGPQNAFRAGWVFTASDEVRRVHEFAPDFVILNIPVSSISAFNRVAFTIFRDSNGAIHLVDAASGDIRDSYTPDSYPPFSAAQNAAFGDPVFGACSISNDPESIDQFSKNLKILKVEGPPFTGVTRAEPDNDGIASVDARLTEARLAKLDRNLAAVGDSMTIDMGQPTPDASTVGGQLDAAGTGSGGAGGGPDLTIDSSVDDPAPTNTSFIAAAGLSTIDDFFNGMVLVFTSGVLNGRSAAVADYDGATRRVTLTGALPAVPADTDTFSILGLA